jgi:hypothetical protein
MSYQINNYPWQLQYVSKEKINQNKGACHRKQVQFRWEVRH